MFKDVISTGWWRIHLIIFAIGFGPPPFIFILFLIFNSYDSSDYEQLGASLLWLSCAIVYLIIFRIVVWVKRGFKKS